MTMSLALSIISQIKEEAFSQQSQNSSRFLSLESSKKFVCYRCWCKPKVSVAFTHSSWVYHRSLRKTVTDSARPTLKSHFATPKAAYRYRRRTFRYTTTATLRNFDCPLRLLQRCPSYILPNMRPILLSGHVSTLTYAHKMRLANLNLASRNGRWLKLSTFHSAPHAFFEMY